MTTTTLTSWALLIWNALQKDGIDARAVFEQAELDPTKLGDGNARYKIEGLFKVWQEAIEQSNNPCFGVEVGKLWSPTSFHALGFAWLASASLHDAFQRMSRFSRLINDSLTTDLTRVGTNYRFQLNATDGEQLIHPAGVDAAISAIVKMCRMLIGDSFSPIEIQMKTARTESAICLETAVGAPIIYNKENFILLIDHRDVERILPGSNTELIRVNENVALQYLSKLDRCNLTAQVKAKIVTLLPTGDIKEEQIATVLNLSLRSFQRKLREEGEGFTNILTSIKKQMAKNYIQDSQLSINEIAYLLGFSDQANFTRAFRRWNGSTPSNYRKNIISNQA
jgi:AraC-like DNA-binding protein